MRKTDSELKIDIQNKYPDNKRGVITAKTHRDFLRDLVDSKPNFDELSASGSIYSSSFTGSLTVPNDVGGITSGTTVASLTGKTYSQLFDDLLFPTVNPTFVNPSSTFTDNVNSLYEVSQSVSITFTSTFNRGQILLNGSEQDKRSGLPNQYVYTGDGLTTTPSTSLTNSQTITHEFSLGNQSWTNYVSYDEGPQPLDSKGDDFSSPLSAGDTSTDTITIEGVYPLFGSTSDITTATKQSLVSMISANNISLSLVAETGGNKQFLDIPDAWLSSRSLQGIQTYNTLNGQWEYQGGSAASSKTFWTTTSTTQTIQGDSVDYTRYTYNGSDRGATTIRLVF